MVSSHLLFMYEYNIHCRWCGSKSQDESAKNAKVQDGKRCRRNGNLSLLFLWLSPHFNMLVVLIKGIHFTSIYFFYYQLNVSTIYKFQEKEEERLRRQFRLEGKQVLPKQETELSDSNIITPGTDFMCKLSKELQSYIRLRIKHKPGWKKVKVNHCFSPQFCSIALLVVDEFMF